VFNLLGVGGEFRRPGTDEGPPLRACIWMLNALKEFDSDLAASSEQGGGWLVNVTALGGKFGLGGVDGALPLATAGTPGVVKSMAREYPAMRLVSVDVDPTLPPAELAERLRREFGGDGPIEVGLDRGGRWRIDLRPDPFPADRGPLPLGPDSVVLITGGARGVTAGVARALAEAARCHLVLVGSSPLPEPEPAETTGLDRAGLRRYLIEQARARGVRTTPADVERAVNRTLRERQIHDTLRACTAAGARVEYHSVDIRDSERFGTLIDDLYRRLGRIDGVLHGAGVIDDKLIPNKSEESFAAVFRTKADSALTLARKLRPQGLKFCLFFSSVVGRFGNPGQADYSAANEFLNKLAGDLDRRWPARVVAVNWGAWDGGMVTEPTRDLTSMYEKVGIKLMPVPEGAAACLDELRPGPGRGHEVLLAASVGRMIELSVQGR
jgi:NAD(P)-dependent dehydrogenase (short-subunit alcohol dehydrogenase family)